MTMTEHALESLKEIEHHVTLLTVATRPDEILSATSNYLASWPKERIANLQKIDGGWGTFDSRQRPESIHGVADITRISEVLSRHCRALRAAGMEPTPELLELDLYFALAKQVAERFMPRQPRPVTGSARGTATRHLPDRDAMAA